MQNERGNSLRAVRFLDICPVFAVQFQFRGANAQVLGVEIVMNAVRNHENNIPVRARLRKQAKIPQIGLYLGDIYSPYRSSRVISVILTTCSDFYYLLARVRVMKGFKITNRCTNETPIS